MRRDPRVEARARGADVRALEHAAKAHGRFAHWLGQFTLPWSLLFLGEWGEALNELDAGVAMARKRPMVKVLTFIVAMMKTCSSGPCPGKARIMSGTP